jgi:hypothetical protein
MGLASRIEREERERERERERESKREGNVWEMRSRTCRRVFGSESGFRDVELSPD